MPEPLLQQKLQGKASISGLRTSWIRPPVESPALPNNFLKWSLSRDTREYHLSDGKPEIVVVISGHFLDNGG
jgi:hypothetical protein